MDATQRQRAVPTAADMDAHLMENDLEDMPLTTQEAQQLWRGAKKGQPASALWCLNAPKLAQPTPASWRQAMTKLAPHDHPAVPARVVTDEQWAPSAVGWQSAIDKLKNHKPSIRGVVIRACEDIVARRQHTYGHCAVAESCHVDN